MGRGQNTADAAESRLGADGAVYKRGRRRTGQLSLSPSPRQLAPVYDDVVEVTNLDSLGQAIAADEAYTRPFQLKPDYEGSSVRSPDRPVVVSTEDGDRIGIIPISGAGEIVELLERGCPAEAHRDPRSSFKELLVRVIVYPKRVR